MTTKVWNLKYYLGNSERVLGDAGNPQSRKSALAGAATIEKNGWAVWVEHHTSGKRIYESARAIERRQEQAPGAAQPGRRHEQLGITLKPSCNEANEG